jgi:protein-L-isoaspartate(D-aspartate) O-methyltransferase
VKYIAWNAFLVVTALAFVSFGQDTGPRDAAVDLSRAPDTTAVDTTEVAVSKKETPPWQPPTPPAAKERTEEREQMVDTQIQFPTGHRTPVADPVVLAAMRAVPRHAFVTKRYRKRAYNDTPLPIGHGQTISQPYMVAFMTELLELTPGSRVLEVGTGSGYQAAVLAHLTPHVYTIEIMKPLAERAGKTLAENGYDNVHVLGADGYFGWEEHAPFDAIIVTCAAGHLPPPLWEQIKPGGRIVVPIGSPFSVQRLVLVEKTTDGKRRSDTVMAVRFVPMTGKVSQK